MRRHRDSGAHLQRPRGEEDPAAFDALRARAETGGREPQPEPVGA